MNNVIITFILAITGIVAAAKTAPPSILLVKNGQPEAIIVTADKPSPVAKFASEELGKYIKKATGADLKIVTESNAPKIGVKIYVGTTDAAKKVGLTQDKFKGEDYEIKAEGGNLYILGNENDKKIFLEKDPKNSKKENRAIMINCGIVPGTQRGTLYGVYYFLDRFLGIKWLWPGELGTYVPKRKSLAVNDKFNIKNGPAFKFRKYRIWHVFVPLWLGKYNKPDVKTMSFSLTGLKRYYDAVRRYIVVHQAGETEPQPTVGHYFEGWWSKYGKEHPEWFTKHDDGKRGPYEKPYQTRMCFTNPELQRFIVEKWDGGDILKIGEADHRGFCRCAKCKEWDKPQPKNYKGYSTSNRYVRFAQKIHEMAVKRNPKVKLTTFLYMDYIHPPTIKTNLSWLYGEFVPWGSGYECYYPMSNAAAKANKDAWLGWSKTGMEIGYRPNYLLSGYALPALDLEQTGNMIKVVAKNGGAGFDYDSLFGYWATKGPMLYMHMRLGTDPDLSIADIKKEYYSAFGPAAEDVEKYFDYWINYTKKLSQGGVTYANALGAVDMYPPKVFIRGDKLLNNALIKAKNSNNPEFAQRVEFLQNGLKHGKLATEFAHLYKKQDFEKARKVLLELIKFRRAHEKDFIADYVASAFTETRTYKDLTNFIKGKFMNFSDPGFQATNKRGRKFKKKYVYEIKNLRPGLWGLVLSEKHKNGFVIFKYETKNENCFTEAYLKPNAGFSGYNDSLDISYDGINYQTIKKNIGKKKIDLTKYVKGKCLFFLRFNVKRKNGYNKKILALAQFKLTYAKKHPDKKKIHPKLEIGTGWLTPWNTWYFLKDPKNKGLSKAQFMPKTFNSKGWTKVEVGANLDVTAVGPYLGYGWYAVKFNIPQDWAGRDVEILFKGIDKQAWVYVNGRLVDEITTKAKKMTVQEIWSNPFIVKVPAADIKVGTTNLLMVRIHSSFGAMGLYKPVCLRPVDQSAL